MTPGRATGWDDTPIRPVAADRNVRRFPYLCRNAAPLPRQAGQPPENMNTPPVILAIAGSDPSGGAGIQADIKTVSALGGYAAAAVTAITVQNTRGVAQVEYLSPETVGRQCGAVIEDLSPDAVKIGMTGTPAIISAIAEVLERYGCRNVVFDPVALSTSGKILTQPDALETACNRLFPLCRVVTPTCPKHRCSRESPSLTRRKCAVRPGCSTNATAAPS